MQPKHAMYSVSYTFYCYHLAYDLGFMQYGLFTTSVQNAIAGY